jgi:DNA topoisomerase I
LLRIDSDDINGYVKDVTGEDFTAKDFRTWAGTMLAVKALRDCPPASTKVEAEKNVVRAIESVARMLGNTRAVCRKSYVHPGIIDCYIDGAMEKVLSRRFRAARKNTSGLRADEVAVMVLLAHLQVADTDRRKAA